MKNVFLLIMATLFAIIAHSQEIVGVQCPGCGVYLEGNATKHFDDPDYHRSGCTYVKKSENNSSSSVYHEVATV